MAVDQAKRITWSDIGAESFRLFLGLLGLFAVLMFRRAKQRRDTPPPGFVLVGLAFLCVSAGTLLAVFQPGEDEAGTYWVNLQRLLCYQGFVLLPSGDFWPKIMVSHYSWGAVIWIAGVLVWSCFVLPKVLRADNE